MKVKLKRPVITPDGVWHVVGSIMDVDPQGAACMVKVGTADPVEEKKTVQSDKED